MRPFCPRSLCAWGLALGLAASQTPADPLHSVRRGETLGLIASRYGVQVDDLRRWNDLRGDRIYPEQKLRVEALPAAKPQTHTVQRGDTLHRLGIRYGLSVEQIRALNGLNDDRIYPGQKLRVAADTTSEYVVRRGDNLSEIAVRHGMTLSQLRSLNQLRGNVIHPGQRLRVHDAGIRWVERGQIDWSTLVAGPNRLSALPAHNGPYFHSSPSAEIQNGRNYSEGTPLAPMATYRRAAALFSAFADQVSALGRAGSELEGWHVVLDPGHGGVDPGAIVKTVDGNGDALYVVEDEYVYDMALRLYALLRLYGADVTLTVLSPNHLMRRNVPAARTFVHERNEVFNDAKINARNSASSWPRGGSHGLATRKQVIASAVQGKRAQHTIFISLHADNTPARSADPVVLYYERPGHRDHRSARFAQQLLPWLGENAQSKGQRLAVLRDNPADVAVLMEMRNLAYAQDSWALRFEEDRQRDAERILDALLHVARKSSLPAVARAR